MSRKRRHRRRHEEEQSRKRRKKRRHEEKKSCKARRRKKPGSSNIRKNAESSIALHFSWKIPPALLEVAPWQLVDALCFNAPLTNKLPSGKASEVMRKWTQAAPVPCPISVTLRGSPPKLAIFSWTQWRAAIWSKIPRLEGCRLLPSVLALRKPRERTKKNQGLLLRCSMH